MLTAKEARKILAGSKKAQEDDLAKIEEAISKQAAAGKTLYQAEVITEEWVPIFMDMFEAAGFDVRVLHAKGIEIRW